MEADIYKTEPPKKPSTANRATSPDSCSCSRMEIGDLLERWKTIKSFSNEYDLVKCSSAFRDMKQCVMVQSPTLGQLQTAFGNKMKLWMQDQINNVTIIAGVRDKLLAPQILMLIDILTARPNIKASCLMNFLYGLVSGVWGRFYGSIDVMQIGEAWQAYLRQVKQTEVEIEEQAMQEQKARLQANEVRISYDEYRAAKLQEGITLPSLDKLLSKVTIKI